MKILLLFLTTFVSVVSLAQSSVIDTLDNGVLLYTTAGVEVVNNGVETSNTIPEIPSTIEQLEERISILTSKIQATEDVNPMDDQLLLYRNELSSLENQLLNLKSN